VGAIAVVVAAQAWIRVKSPNTEDLLAMVTTMVSDDLIQTRLLQTKIGLYLDRILDTAGKPIRGEGGKEALVPTVSDLH